MKTPKKLKTDQFDHAADLPAAYREMAAAFAGLVELEASRVLQARVAVAADPARVIDMSPCAVWQAADAHAEAWQRVGTAARRVQVALSGRKGAGRWEGFTTSRPA